MAIVETWRFHVIQAFQAWLRTGEPSDKAPKLFAKKVKYPGSDEWRTLYYIKRGSGEPEMVVTWNRAINTLYPTVEDFDDAARRWERSRLRRIGSAG
jgi:hypothetical protein